MKKILKILCCLIFLISGSLIVFACNNDSIKLTKPISAGFVSAGERDAETGEIVEDQYLLVTDQNSFADGYQFFITENEDYGNLKNYITLPYVKTNYIDVTNTIDRQKTYHFYVQYIGKGRYLNSDYSDISVINPKIVKVDTPYLQMVGTKLHWFKIQNATGYEIYETIVKPNNETSTQKIKTFDANTLEYDFSERLTDENSPYYKYQYQIKALTTGNFIDSDLSEISESVTFVKEITLNKPNNLKIDFSTKTLTFDAVKYATKYEIKVVRTGYEKVVTSETNNVKLDELGVDFSKYDSYKFDVKAIESDVLKYNASESVDLTKDYTINFEKPNNITVSQVGDLITFAWDKSAISLQGTDVEAQSYTLVVSWQSGEQSFDLLRTNLDASEKLSKTLTVSEIFGELTQDTEIVVKVKANALDQYILESDYEISPNQEDPDATKIIIIKQS